VSGPEAPANILLRVDRASSRSKAALSRSLAAGNSLHGRLAQVPVTSAGRRTGLMMTDGDLVHTESGKYGGFRKQVRIPFQ